MAEKKISFYKNVGDMAGNTGLYLDHILLGIKEGRWKEQVMRVRPLYPSDNLKGEEYKEAKRKYQDAKKSLENFTISGLFTRCENDKIAMFSGFMGIDFDALEDVDAFFNEIVLDTYTYAAFRSVSGKGVCVIVKVERDRFAEAFAGLEHYYMQRFQVPVDPSGKNISRRRYVSYDPECEIFNADSPVFKAYLPKPKAKKKERPLFYVNTRNDLEHVFRQIEDQSLDLTANYDDWYQLGFAFINEFGEAGLDYFVRVSQFHPDFDQRKVEKKFNTLLRQKPRTVTIAKFFSLAKKAGIDILSDRTKNIAKVAQMQKKAGSSRDSIVETLRKMDGIAVEESKPVVDAVFDSGATVDTEESIVDKIEMYIQRNCPIRYNLVKHRNEFVKTGQDVGDREEATLYLELRRAFGKEITKADVMAYLYSTMVPEYNPILEFFQKHQHRRPVGAIQSICNSITPRLNEWTQKNLPIYVKYYLTRWIVGLVASCHGDPSPLTLVLVGSEGNTGKTQFFRRLLPDEMKQYYAESKFDQGKDDMMLLYTKILVMNDEYGGGSKEARYFKNLTSKEKVQIRKFYGRHTEAIQRLACFGGTCNEIEIIDDPTTDNRRVIPIEVLKIDHELYNSVDKIDLLMEAYHLWKDGYSHHLNREEILQLKQATHQFHEYSYEREMLQKLYRVPDAESDWGLRVFLSPTEIKNEIDKESKQAVSLKRVGMELKAIGYEQESRTINGQKKRGYWVIRTS